MEMKRQTMNLLAIGSDDEKHTYEVYRQWNEGDKKAIVIEIYPTLAPSEQCIKNDLSSFHLMNHVSELGWDEMRLINLYSKVFSYKPSGQLLKKEDLNLPYIEQVLNEPDIKEISDIVIAWGTSLQAHKTTNQAKLELLLKLKEKGLEDQVKQIVTEDIGERDNAGIHPLFLGLQHSRSKWLLSPYPLEEEIERLSQLVDKKASAKKKGGKPSGTKDNK